jgi:toxin ParE1/3/4
VTREVSFHPGATTELSELHAYIAAEAGPARATAYLDRLEAACLRLGLFPQMGRPAEELGVGMRLGARPHGGDGQAAGR